MEVALTTLSNQLYLRSRLRLCESARRFGILDVRPFDFDSITETVFFKENKEIMSHPRTMGYWLWKPFIISEVIKTVAEGDIVIYCDAGIEIIAGLKPLIELCAKEADIMLFANSNFENAMWTKRDCFVLMNSDDDKYWYGRHCDASFCIIRKSAKSLEFLREWLYYGCNVNIITGQPNICGLEDLPEFIEHRYDQSILSLLAIKYKLTLYRMPTQFGNHYKAESERVPGEINCVNQSDRRQVDYYSNTPFTNSPYTQLLNHHREKNSFDPNTNMNLKQTTKLMVDQVFSYVSRAKTRINNFRHSKIRKTYRKISYAQCGEDLIVKYIFSLRGIRRPSYIDIGANHPYFLSNTALFYQSGCKGVNIEANPLLHNDFKIHRPNDINLNVGIGVTNEELDFYIMADNTLSTFSKEESDLLVSAGKSLARIERVKLTTVNSVLNENCNGIFPDFLSIDVEGLDFQILKSINFEKSSPKVICVEAAEYSAIGAGARRSELIDFLTRKGYYEYANTNLNAIMVKREFWFI